MLSPTARLKTIIDIPEKGALTCKKNIQSTPAEKWTCSLCFFSAQLTQPPWVGTHPQLNHHVDFHINSIYLYKIQSDNDSSCYNKHIIK